VSAFAPIALLLLLAGANAAEPTDTSASGLVIDRTVAVVHRQPLLLSELELEARVAFIQQGAVEAASAALTEEDLARTLDYVIGQKLAYEEAERLQVFEVADPDVATALRAFVARFPNEQAYRGFLLQQEASEDQLAAILRRDLRVARFVESKVKLSARVAEEDLRSWYDAHASELGGQTYAQAREAIRARLTRDRYRTLAGRLLGELRGRAEVRLLASFARPAASEAAASTGEQP
jgi:hypothetical protein